MKTIQQIPKASAKKKVKRSIVVATRTGGQGKTLATQLFEFAAVRLGHAFDVVSVDSTGDDAGMSTSKLKAILPRARQLTIGASLADIAVSGSRALMHWDAFSDMLASGNVLADLGANIIPYVFQHARETQDGESLQPIQLVIPVTRQAQSAADAVDIIQEALECVEYFPVTRIAVLLNAVHGPVLNAEGASFEALKTLLRDPRVVSCQIDRCASEAWEQISAQQPSFATLCEMTRADYQSKFNLDRGPASRGRRVFVEWLDEQIRRLAAIGLPLDRSDRDGSISAAAADSGFSS